MKTVNRCTLLISCIIHAAGLVGSNNSPVDRTTTVQDRVSKESHFFELGQEAGKKIIGVLQSRSTTPEQDIFLINQQTHKEITEEFKLLSTTPLHSPDYIARFLLLKRYMVGIKSIIEQYELVPSDDPFKKKRNDIAVHQLITLECFIHATDHHEWRKNLEELMENSENDAFPDDTESANQAGYELGKIMRSCVMNTELTEEIKQTTHKQCTQMVTEFFSEIAVLPILEKRKALFSYFSGIKKALKEPALKDALSELPTEQRTRIQHTYEKILRATHQALSFAFHSWDTLQKSSQ